MIWALVRDIYGYGRHFGSFYRNPTILETVSDFDSSSWQLNLSTTQNDFSKFRPGWWQFCWMTGVKFNSIHSILVKFLHITVYCVCAAKNLTVFVADSPRCLEWSSMVAAVSRALHELSEPCLGWTREPRGQTKSLGARWQFSQVTVNNVLPVMTGSPAFLTQPPPAGFDCLGQQGECFSLKYNDMIILAPICLC